MRPQAVWQGDPVFIEIGVKDADLARNLRREGYSKYLGVSSNPQRIAEIQSQHPDLADDVTCFHRRQLVRHNNADVLILSGFAPLYLWNYRFVRHAQSVAWRVGLNPLSLLALLMACVHVISRRYGRPRIVTIRTPGEKVQRLFVFKILRRKKAPPQSRYFAAHRARVRELFQDLEQRDARYVVLRGFESCFKLGPCKEIEMLVADESLDCVLDALQSRPGILPCYVYSENGLARSDYRGTPRYPSGVARRLLKGRRRHRSCMVPNPHDQFHCLAYNAVYHGSSPDLAAIEEYQSPNHADWNKLRTMANRLGTQVDISLEGLHFYLQNTGWGPSPEMLARLAVACPGNEWLQTVAARLDRHVHDQGLAVFVLRRETVQRGFTDLAVNMIEASGFEILAAKKLSEAVTQKGAAQTRGGNWRLKGPYDISGGPPAAIVVAHDRDPIPMTRRQQRLFPTRTNARLFAKQDVRDAILSKLPANERFNALHSSDHAAEAWHLIDVLAPELTEAVRCRLTHASNQTPSLERPRRAA